MSLSVWMAVKIGGVAMEQLISTLEGEGSFVGDEARTKSMMKQTASTTSLQIQTLSLARYRIRDLGFTETPTFTQVKQRVKELGGMICPSQLGPHLCHQLSDRGKEVLVWLVMEPISHSDSYPYIFRVGRFGDGKKWIDADEAHPDDPWGLDAEVVFVLAS